MAREACAHSSRRRRALQTDRASPARTMIPESVTELRVRYAETDQMGVVYHANYLIWCEIARTDLIRTFGASYRELEERGVRLAVSEASVRYIAAARYDDRIRVETRLSRVTSRTMIFDYTILNADSSQRLATASTTLISLDPSNRVTVLPAEVRRALSGRRGARCVVAARSRSSLSPHARAARRVRVRRFRGAILLVDCGRCRRATGGCSRWPTSVASTPRWCREFSARARAPSARPRRSRWGRCTARCWRPRCARSSSDRDTTVAANAAYALGMLADTGRRSRRSRTRSTRRPRWAERRVGARPDRRAGASGDRGRARTQFAAPSCARARRAAPRDVPAQAGAGRSRAPVARGHERARALERRLCDRAPVRARGRARPHPARVRHERRDSRAGGARVLASRRGRLPRRRSCARRSPRSRDDPNAHVRINALHSLATYGVSSMRVVVERHASIAMRTCASPPRRSSAPCSTTTAPRG